MTMANMEPAKALSSDDVLLMSNFDGPFIPRHSTTFLEKPDREGELQNLSDQFKQLVELIVPPFKSDDCKAVFIDILSNHFS